MKSVGLIGANGFVGRSIRKYILNNKEISTTCITRENYEEAKQKKEYDVLINAAMPSKRFWASQNPHLDFHETVKKTFDIVNDWKSSKIIQISSISARSQLNTTYGRHKAAAEKIVSNENNLILRLGPMYGERLSKGVLIDLLTNNRIYISKESLYCFAPVEWVGEWIATNMHLCGIQDLGGNNAISVGEVARLINSKSIFEGPIDNQVLSKEIKSGPESNNVINYILSKNN
ncbi:NAD-dependent epimerase/dehydratase family protein [Prochlorococcus marinus]|uniref:NAD-dependent epimerase/dehydratase family protein n=1 Tax=Prochlorococcus marinus TaxID=1219 RepID=UPI0022B4A344|nr:NAD-dependent epimerase/dehydratase family protein [Prochlorococcus marinus]